MSRHKGAFVYEGSGKKQSVNAPPEQKLCTDEAIRIQRCMAYASAERSRTFLTLTHR